MLRFPLSSQGSAGNTEQFHTVSYSLLFMQQLSQSWQMLVMPAVGLVSYVKKDGLRADVWGDEAMFTNVGLRSGTHRFHNILFVGKQVTDPLSWTVGYGFGPHFTLSKSGYIEIDLIFQVIGDIARDMANWEDSSCIGKYRLIGGWKIFDFISIYAGPTFNSFRSNENDGSEYALWTISEDKEGDTWTRTSIGFVLGMKILK